MDLVRDRMQESLQPQRIKAGEKGYESVLDIEERLRKNDATNIALTGPYGSGKSSILSSLKIDFQNYKYLDISLATLQPFKDSTDTTKEAVTDQKQQNTDSLVKEVEIGNEDDNNKTRKTEKGSNVSKENLDRLIEYSILQQLIYREKQETLPNSRIKRIYHLPQKKVKVITITTMLAFLSLVIVLEPSFLKVDWLCSLFGRECWNKVADTLCLLYLAIYAFYALKEIVPALSNSRLNKLNLKSGEIEIVNNTSIFNKHLDEILYFFEMTEYNVVILEDLDRFGSTAIFLKLRELNLLLNESKVIGRKIFFIYAVRDDMFNDAERVKCFDYIATVIPIINPSNAKSKLKEELNKRGVTNIKDYVLKDFGFFLRDMRLLKNITNEYVQYKGRLAQGIGYDKLLAMIVYKNYFPKDFAELHDCEGTLYKLLRLKDVFISKKIAEIEAENERKQELKLRYRQEKSLKVVELRRIYVDAYRDKLGDRVQQLKAGDNFYNFNDIAKNEKLFDKLIADPTVTYMSILPQNHYNAGRSQANTTKIKFNDIENAVNPNYTYKERLEALRETFNELESDTILEIRKEDIRSQSLNQIMSEIDYSQMPEYKALQVPQMIEYLVVKGYLDENYYDYISYFYDNFIDGNDWNFVLDLKLGKLHPYDFSVHKVDVCLQEIPSEVFRKPAILNIDIVDYLAEHVSEREHSKQLLVVLRTLIGHKKFDFIVSYYEKGHQQDTVFSQLFNQYKELWPEFEKNDNDKNKLKLIWYKYAEEDLSCESSQEWLSQHYDFVTDHLLDVDEDKWSILVQKNDYLFKELNRVSSVVLKTIADRDAYELTKHNVETIVSSLLDVSFDSISYRIILETEHSELIKRVKLNLRECVKSVFSVPESKSETAESIVEILRSDVPEEEKIKYLACQNNHVELDKLDTKELKVLAIKCDVVEPIWENIILYMSDVSEKTADDVISAFIEKHADELSTLEVSHHSEEDRRMLLRQLIKTDILSFEAYEKIINQFTGWTFTGIPTVEERRVLLLIEKGTVPFREENTMSLYENYSFKVLVAYLLKNKRDFLKAPESVEYTTEVAQSLMKAGLTISEKALIIPHFDKKILNEELANQILLVLKVRDISLDTDFLLTVMGMSNMTDEKIKVLGSLLSKYTYEETVITSFLKTLSGKYKNIAEKGKKPEIPNTPHNLKLVETLEEIDYISTHSVSKTGIRVNTKQK